MTSIKTRALGKVQAAFLRAMLDHGGFWHEKCGWNWESHLGTIRLCEALARRGLLVPGALKMGSPHAQELIHKQWVIKDKTAVERALKAVEPRNDSLAHDKP